MPWAHKRRRLSPTLLPGCRALCPASSPASREVYTSAGLLDSLVPLPETRKKRTFPGAQNDFLSSSINCVDHPLRE